jgi:hypothetical protein
VRGAERGEQRIQRQQDIMAAIAAKLERYRNPWQELKLQYGANKGKAYTGAPAPSCPCCRLAVTVPLATPALADC